MTMLTAQEKKRTYLCLVLVEEVVLKHRLGQTMRVVTGLLKLADTKAVKADTDAGVSPVIRQVTGMLRQTATRRNETHFIVFNEKDWNVGIGTGLRFCAQSQGNLVRVRTTHTAG